MILYLIIFYTNVFASEDIQTNKSWKYTEFSKKFNICGKEYIQICVFKFYNVCKKCSMTSFSLKSYIAFQCDGNLNIATVLPENLLK